MQSDHFALGVHPGAALARTSEEYTHLAGIHLVEQLLLLFGGIIVMDKGYFFLRHALGYQLVLNIIINILKCGNHYPLYKA
ncbi:MAG: hypothetical protein IK999_08805 [Ruminococcus sp.]|nr:hypothetical protein [Ruminococcus sp.]